MGIDIKKIRAAAIGLLMLGAAGEAWALSCSAPNLAAGYNMAVADPAAAPVLALGTLVAAKQPPEPRGGGASATLQFQGVVFTADGARRDTARPVDATLLCLGPWCGAWPDLGQEPALLLRQTQTGLALLLGPCGGATHPRPTAAQAAALATCAAQGRCADPAVGLFNPD